MINYVNSLLLSSSNNTSSVIFGGFVKILKELHIRRAIPQDEAPLEVTDSPVY